MTRPSRIGFPIPIDVLLLEAVFLHERLVQIHLAGMPHTIAGMASIEGLPWRRVRSPRITTPPTP